MLIFLYYLGYTVKLLLNCNNLLNFHQNYIFYYLFLFIGKKISILPSIINFAHVFLDLNFSFIQIINFFIYTKLNKLWNEQLFLSVKSEKFYFLENWRKSWWIKNSFLCFNKLKIFFFIQFVNGKWDTFLFETKFICR